LKEKVLQHLSIKKIITRNFNCEDHSNVKKIPIPFLGLSMTPENINQKVLLQMSQEKDIMSLYSDTPVMAFTENDIFEGLGIRQT
jgi:hypothetical protein